MLQPILRATTGLAGAGLVFLGLLALLVPLRLMPHIGLESPEALGLNFMRGDVAASLGLIGLLALRAALAGDGRRLDIPLAWAGLVIAGRLLGLVLDAGAVAHASALVPGLLLFALMMPARLWLRPAGAAA